MSALFNFIGRVLQVVSWTDIIDVLLIAWILYRFFKLSKGTNVIRLLRGVIALLVALFLSDVLHLRIINYILVNVMQLGFIAIIILFQPELRRFLEKMGKNRLPFFKDAVSDKREGDIAIIQTIEAVAEMSRSKTGALIVFKNTDSIDDICATGTSIDAAVSAELLKNIFFTKAPLHDGAVVIENWRIKAAGCLLPLSANENISKELGTRHRAAIGMSEHYDSLCVVVSEETGSISLSMNGVIKRHLAPETLERLLYNNLLPEPSEEEKNSKVTFERVLEWLRIKK